MRWTGCVLGLALATAAFAGESEPDSAAEPKRRRVPSRTFSVETLKEVRARPDDFEGGVKTLSAALRKISDKRYRRTLAYRLRVLRKKGGILLPSRGQIAAEAYAKARELLDDRRDDYVGNVRKLELLAAKAAGTRYEGRIKVFLELQKDGAEQANWERNPKYKLMDIEEHVRDHPQDHYSNVQILERAVRKFADLEEVESTKGLLLAERANWESQKAELERKIESGKELLKAQPDEHEVNRRILESLLQEVVETPLEREVEKLLASIGGAEGQLDRPVEVELTEEETLVKLVAEAMLAGASEPGVALASRVAEDAAREEGEEKRRAQQLEEAIGRPKTARELRKAAEKAASMPWGREKAVELYERAGASGDPVDAPLAWKDLGRLLASLPLEDYPPADAAKRGPDSWRYALTCFEKARKSASGAASEELALDEGRLCAELAEHFGEKGEDELARNYEERAGLALKPLAESQDESIRNAALKLLGRLEGSR